MAKSLSSLMFAVSCAVALLLSGCGGKDDAVPEQEAAPDTHDLLMALSNRMKAAKDIGNPVVKTEEYLAIARELQALQNFKDSVAPLKNAAGTTGWLSSPADQGRIQAEIAVLLYRAKKPDDAKKAYDKAIAKLVEITEDDPPGKALLLTHLASADHEAGKNDEAKARLKLAEETAKQIAATEKERRVVVLLAVAQAAKRNGDKATANSVAGNLLNWLDEVPAPLHAEMAIAVAELLHGISDDKSEEKQLQAGIDAAQKVDDKAAQAKLLVAAATVRNAWSQSDKAKPLLDQAEKQLPSVTDKGQQETLKAKIKIERELIERHAAKKAEKK